VSGGQALDLHRVNLRLSSQATAARSTQAREEGGCYRAVMSWTVEDHLRDTSENTRRLYAAFERLITACGSYERTVTKTAIAFKGPVRGFAGVTPRRDRLSGFLDLAEAVHEAPFTRVTPYTKKLWVHRFVLTNLDDLDHAFAARVAQAYAIGQGAHH
jgi:hypothetical protein